MEAIADAVGLRKPSLYHYVKSKDDILVLIHREFMELVFVRAESPGRSALSARQQLVEVMADILGLMGTHRGHVRVFFEHHRELPPKPKRQIALERDRYARMVADILSAGISAREFRPVDVRLASLAVFGMCNWAYQWYDPEGGLAPRDIAQTFGEYIVEGIGAHSGKH
jgi:AcrR family transcriptional regulator